MGKGKEEKGINDIPLSTNMSDEEYAHGKVKRLSYLIDNETDQDTIDYYRDVKRDFMAKLPDEVVEKKADETARELDRTTREIADVKRKQSDIRGKAEAKRQEAELSKLEKERQRKLKEMHEIEKALALKKRQAKAGDADDGLQECPVCGEKLKNPEHPSHVNSEAHQTALKEQKQEESAGTD